MIRIVTAGRLRRLEQDAEANRSLVLLFHWGEPHSIHRSHADAYAYAATLGAPVHGWVPGREHSGAPVAWTAVPFIADDGVNGFRPTRSARIEWGGGGS